MAKPVLVEKTAMRFFRGRRAFWPKKLGPEAFLPEKGGQENPENPARVPNRFGPVH